MIVLISFLAFCFFFLFTLNSGRKALSSDRKIFENKNHQAQLFIQTRRGVEFMPKFSINEQPQQVPRYHLITTWIIKLQFAKRVSRNFILAA